MNNVDKVKETTLAERATSRTEEFYWEMKALREELLKERNQIQGITQKTLELDDFLPRVNSVINALAPIYQKSIF